MSYFLVEDGSITKHYPRSLPRSWRNISGLDKATPEHLKSLGFLPERKVGESAVFDPSTDKLIGPEHTIGADEVVSTWSVVSLSALDIQHREEAIANLQTIKDADEVSRVYTDIDTVLGKLIFKLVNRVLVLEGKPTITAGKFREYADSLKKEPMPKEPVVVEEPVL